MNIGLAFVVVLAVPLSLLAAQQPASLPASQPALPTASAPAEPDEISLKAIAAFDTVEKAIGPDGYSRSAKADPLAWGESYIMAAYLAMYEGTGQQRDLDRLLDHIEHVLANRGDRLGQVDEIRGRAMPAWITSGYSGGKPYAWTVHAGMITAPMARCAYVLKRDPQLAARYAAQIEAILADVAQTIKAFEPDWREGPAVGEKSAEGYYFCPFMKSDLPYNMQNALGRAILAMYLATGDEWYLQRATKLARYFDSRLWRMDDNRRYLWSYWVHHPAPEDISHAAINVDFVAHCWGAGIVFDRGDMRRFAAALERALTDEGVAATVEGVGPRTADPQVLRWGRLAMAEPRLRPLLLNHMLKSNPDSTAVMLGAAYLVLTQSPSHKDMPLEVPPE